MTSENLPIHCDIQPLVTPFFDDQTNTYSYVVKDPASQSCAVIDSVLDIDYAAGRISTAGADRLMAYIRDQQLELSWIIETHVHADHLSAAPYIQQQLGGQIGIGKHITQVQNTFGKVFNAGTEFARDGSQFDRLFDDGDEYQVGEMSCTAIHTPGHTPACMAHIMGDSVFVGDTLFMPDGGTARADFPGGDARTLYRSIQRLLSLPEELRVFVCHDYMPNDREARCETTIGEQRLNNIHVGANKAEGEFVRMRESRDQTLGMPRLILPSLQVNMWAGHLPSPEDNGVAYLKIPLNVFGSDNRL